MKVTYDPALRETESGKRLYYYWKQVRKKSYSPEWDLFPNFYEWAMANGFILNAKLCLIDATLPYSPDNCVWKVKEAPEEGISRKRADEWNLAINRLRKQFGMEPLEGTSHEY